MPLGFRGRNWLNIIGKNLEKDHLDFAVYFDEKNNYKIINKKIINFDNYKFEIDRDLIKSDDIIYATCSRF